MPLWETFLLQMDDFERFLEVELRRMLDPVVALRPPTRGGLKQSRKPILAVIAPAIELAAEAIPVVEPQTTVSVPVAPAHTI